MKLARDDVEGTGSQRRRHTFDWIPTVNDMMWPGNWFKEFRSIYFPHLSLDCPSGIKRRGPVWGLWVNSIDPKWLQDTQSISPIT